MKNDLISKVAGNIADSFSSQFDIYDELARLYEELRLVNIDKEIVNSEWWKNYKKWALENIANYDSQIVRLSSDPVKNDREITKKHSLRESLSMLISVVESRINSEAGIVTRIKQYEEITKQSKP